MQAARGDTEVVLRSARLAADTEWSGKFPERDDRWWVSLLGPDAPLDRLDHLGTLRYYAPRVWGPILHAKGRR